ncbi:MAG: extracellular solute-binding protein [Lachnospiraceae bacterium]|nr:extracellular solute-binding protein [Lachnospiraceae bacterium]
MKRSTYVKKIVASVLCSAMTIFMVGCGGSGKETSTTNAAQTTANNVTNSTTGDENVVIKMTWWGGQTRHDQTQAVCDLYTSQHPNVTFELSPSGWDGYFDKLSTQTASGSMPDIVQMDYLYLTTYAKNDSLTNLQEFIDNGTYYIPSIIGGSIAVSVVWKQIFGNQGVAMTLLNAIGIHQKTSFLGNVHTALGVIILMGVWQFGSSMLIFLSALKQIPHSLYESAMVDGAKPWKIFTRITLPMLTPTIFFNLILQIINGFRVFTESYVITDGGPLDSTLSYVLYMYRRAFTYFDMGYSCALAWILVAIIGVFTVILFKTQGSWVHYEAGRE